MKVEEYYEKQVNDFDYDHATVIFKFTNLRQ